MDRDRWEKLREHAEALRAIVRTTKARVILPRAPPTPWRPILWGPNDLIILDSLSLVKPNS